MMKIHFLFLTINYINFLATKMQISRTEQRGEK